LSSKKLGRLVILSSPSGGGKTSICRKLLTSTRKRSGWTFSVSYTTRARRKGEREGREYYFIDDAKFQELVSRDFFAEHFKVHLYNYGTPRHPIDSARRSGGVMLLDVDVQGAARLKQAYPDAIAIFILPPSAVALKKRLHRRGTETKEQLALRFRNATKEMQSFRDYGFDYAVINDDLKTAVQKVLAVIEAHPCRIERLDEEQLAKLAR